MTDFDGWRNATGNAVMHHPECGSLSVPDVLYICEQCGRRMVWCGCRYYCGKCHPEQENTPSLPH